MQKPAMQHVLRTIFFVLNFSQPYAQSSLSMNPNSGHGFRLPAACSKNVTVGWALCFSLVAVSGGVEESRRVTGIVL